MILILEIVVVRDPERADSDAVILLADQLTISLDTCLTVNFHNLGMFFCVMDSRKGTQIRFLDYANLTIITVTQERVDSLTYHASIDTTKLLFRLSYQDILLLQDLYGRIIAPAAAPEIQESIDVDINASRILKENVIVNLNVASS